MPIEFNFIIKEKEEMKCKKCGAEYEGNSCPNGCAVLEGGTSTKKKTIFKKWWFWLIIVLAIIIIGAAGSGGEDTSKSNADPNTDTTQTDATIKEQEEASKEESNIYHKGDVINANGLKITYVDAEKWTGYSQYFPPEDGFMYIRIKVSAENTADADRYFSSFEFEGYADGKKIDQHFETEGALAGGNISAGRTDEGYIYFIVPENAKEIEVEYETSFWTDKKAILKVEL